MTIGSTYTLLCNARGTLLTAYSMGGDKKWAAIREQAKAEGSKAGAKAESIADQAKDKLKGAANEVQKKVS